MGNTDEKALALTQWGAETLDALQRATETDRDAIARRACADAIADARSMAALQGSLFEKLLVIERFGLYRSQGCETIQEFIDRAVAPVVQLHRKTLYRLREAVWEGGRLLERFGTLKADWSNLYLLAAETRRQESGAAVLAADDYERVSREVAEGALSQRELVAVLQPPARPREKRKPRYIDVPERRPTRLSPLDELERISATVRQCEPKAPDLGRTIEMAEELARSLERLALTPADAWGIPDHQRARLLHVLAAVGEGATTVADVVRHVEAA